jgi:hypothetical protein
MLTASIERSLDKFAKIARNQPAPPRAARKRVDPIPANSQSEIDLHDSAQ